MTQGSSGSATVTTAVSGGFSSAVALTAAGAPTGAAATFSPTSIAAPGSGTSTLTIAAGASTAAGTYTITVTGTGGGLTHTATFSLVVSASGGGGGSNTLFSDGFETPSAWTSTQVVNSDGAFAAVLASSTSYPTVSAHGGSYVADFNSYTSQAGSETRLSHTTAFAIPSTYSMVTLTFWEYHDTGYSSDADEVQVQVSTNNSTWTSVGAADVRYTGATGWTQATVDLSAYKGQKHLPRLPRHQRLWQRRLSR